MAITESDTLDLLKWAARSQNEFAVHFWNELCSKLKIEVEVPTSEKAKIIFFELKLYGGNTIVNFFRDDGVPYSEIVFDVVKSLSSFFKKFKISEMKEDVQACEKYILQKMEIDADLKDMIKVIKEKTFSDIGIETGKTITQKVFINKSVKSAALKAAGKFASNEMVIKQSIATLPITKRVITNIARRVSSSATQKITLQITKKIMLKVTMALNVIFAAWTVIDIAGPALRKTLPSVVYIALLRKLYEAEQMNF